MKSKINFTPTKPHSQIQNIEELRLFYIRNYELCFIVLKGPRYNDYVILMKYNQCTSNPHSSFYEYLKIIKAYISIFQELHGHLELIIIPTATSKPFTSFRSLQIIVAIWLACHSIYPTGYSRYEHLSIWWAWYLKAAI